MIELSPVRKVQIIVATSEFSTMHAIRLSFLRRLSVHAVAATPVPNGMAKTMNVTIAGKPMSTLLR